MTASAVPPALMREPDAARWLGICARKLRALRGEGQITYVLIGTAVRYTIDDLQRFVEGQRTTCHSTAAKAPRSGGCRSQSPAVLDFEALRAQRKNAKHA